MHSTFPPTSFSSILIVFIRIFVKCQVNKIPSSHTFWNRRGKLKVVYQMKAWKFLVENTLFVSRSLLRPMIIDLYWFYFFFFFFCFYAILILLAITKIPSEYAGHKFEIERRDVIFDHWNIQETNLKKNSLRADPPVSQKNMQTHSGFWFGMRSPHEVGFILTVYSWGILKLPLAASVLKECFPSFPNTVFMVGMN